MFPCRIELYVLTLLERIQVSIPGRRILQMLHVSVYDVLAEHVKIEIVLVSG